MTNRLGERMYKAEIAVMPEQRHVIVWRELEETPEQAMARHYAEYQADRGAKVMLVGWM